MGTIGRIGVIRGHARIHRKTSERGLTRGGFTLRSAAVCGITRESRTGKTSSPKGILYGRLQFPETKHLDSGLTTRQLTSEERGSVDFLQNTPEESRLLLGGRLKRGRVPDGNADIHSEKAALRCLALRGKQCVQVPLREATNEKALCRWRSDTLAAKIFHVGNAYVAAKELRGCLPKRVLTSECRRGTQICPSNGAFRHTNPSSAGNQQPMAVKRSRMGTPTSTEENL